MIKIIKKIEQDDDVIIEMKDMQPLQVGLIVGGYHQRYVMRTSDRENPL